MRDMTDTPNIIGWPRTARFYSADEQSILRAVARNRAEPLTPQMVNLALAQAREFGELECRPGFETPCGTLAPERRRS
jgi:hypothetical protein